MSYEITSWYSYHQLYEVYQRLGDFKEYDDILIQIELWKANGRMPAAIHATYTLLNALVCDRKALVNDANMINIYAMAIIKSVNHLLDQEQDRFYARSMLMMGKEANLPESVIRCRHRCSHGEIPDIDSLRLVVRDLLNYIYTKYWTPQYNLLVSKLNNEEYDKFWLGMAILTFKNVVNRPKFGSKFRIKHKLVINKLARYRNNKAHDDLHIPFNKLQMKKSLLLKELLSSCKRLLDGCLHEDYFISVLVYYIFYNFKPKQTKYLLLYIFFIAGKLTFNFSFKLFLRMFDIVFGITQRGGMVESYRKALNVPGGGSEYSFEWLLFLVNCSLLELDFQPLVEFMKLSKLLPDEDRRNFQTLTNTALARFKRVIELLLPFTLKKVNRRSKKMATLLELCRRTALSEHYKYERISSPPPARISLCISGVTEDHSRNIAEPPLHSGAPEGIREKEELSAGGKHYICNSCEDPNTSWSDTLDFGSEVLEHYRLSICRLLVVGTIFDDVTWSVLQLYPLDASRFGDCSARITKFLGEDYKGLPLMLCGRGHKELARICNHLLGAHNKRYNDIMFNIRAINCFKTNVN